MKYIFTLLILLSSIVYSNACGNEYGHTIDGKRIYSRNLFLSSRMLNFDSIGIQKRILDLKKKVKENPNNYKNWSDLAVNYLKVGRIDTAVKILIPLIKEYPNEYNIIANLGTAYELNGDLDSALKYISKGYKLNPRSHRGSEWVHQKILQAKIKEKQRPGWLSINPILSQEELLSRLDTTVRNHQTPAEKVNNNIFYQIRTRAPFTPAPNKVIKNLLISLGDFNSENGVYEVALMSYAYAIKYDNSKYTTRLIKNKIRLLNKKRKEKSETMQIHDNFLNIMTRSEINPELMLIGLEDFANKLDSINLKDLEVKDSIALLKTQLDSIQNIEKVVPKKVNTTNENGNSSMLIGVIGFIIGILGALVGSYYYRKTKH